MIDALLIAGAVLAGPTASPEWQIARAPLSVAAIRKASTPPKRWRAFARCVIDRESGATLSRPQSGAGARNPHSSAAGRWQFLQNSWGQSLPYMVRDRLVDHGMKSKEARKVRLYLQSIPIHRWHGRYQDAGAYEVLERGGSHHWRLPGSRCEAFR